MYKIFLLLILLCCFTLNLQAVDCQPTASFTSRSYQISAAEILPSDFLRDFDSAIIKANKRTYSVNKDNINQLIRLRRGVNKFKVVLENCSYARRIVAAPNLFFRPYGTQNSLEKIKFTKLIPDPVGVSDAAESASSLSSGMRETSALFDPEIKLGMAFFGQMLDHDITANNQFQNGPSGNPTSPENIGSPFLDLDNLYGFGRNTDVRLYEDNKLYFLLPGGIDVPRSEDGIALIPDKRDDITGLTLQQHVLFKSYHNFLIKKYLRGSKPSRLTRKQKRWLFEMVRNEVIGTYQRIVASELSTALMGHKLNLKGITAIENVPVEFAAAAYRIGHTLVPDKVKIDLEGNTLSTIDHTLRGPNRIIIPSSLIYGSSAQPAARFDNLIAPVMQELIIPLSPTHPGLTDMVGGSANNIGVGRIVDGTLRLDLVETNILRAREQNLPSGEEVLALINNQSFNETTGTDLFVYVLNEATNNNFKYGKVGAYIFEQTIAGLINMDQYSSFSRKYSRRDKNRFKKRTLSKIAKKVLGF